MKLKLTPELFILQDAVSQPEITTSQDEEKKEINNQAITSKCQHETDLDRKLKQINRTKRFIATPEYQLLNSDQFNQVHPNESSQLNQINQSSSSSSAQTSAYFIQSSQPLEPNIKIIQNTARSALDKRFMVNKRRPRRDIIQSDIRCITLNKEKYGSSFGLTIRGGLDFNKPLIIAAIQRNSTADKCRSLFLGDLIVELNGQSTYPLRFTHEQTMKLIKSGGNRLYLTIKHLTMYNRPIARCWQRQVNMSWLADCDNKAEEDWFNYNLSNSIHHHKFAIIKNQAATTAAATASNTNRFSINKSSSQESNQDPLLLTDCEQYSNCETTTLSNLTAVADKDDLLTPSPLNDEGVYTGLSNDALSSSECTSDASGFSSDYVNSNVNSTVYTSSHSNQNTTYHTHQPNQIDCSSSCCKNSKNNNCCTKCIVNMNHQNGLNNLLSNNNTMISQEQSVDRSLLKNNDSNKENVMGSYSFRNQQQQPPPSQTKHSCSTTNGNQEMISSCSGSFDDRSSSRTSSNRTSLVDIVSVNLINCYFTKYIHNTDNVRRNGMEVRWLNLNNQSTSKSDSSSQQPTNKRSIDVSSAVINFNDVDLAQQFQQKINHYLTKLNESYMFSFNRGLSPQNRILFMGWISLALPRSTNRNQQSLQTSDLQLKSSLDYNWQPKYMIIKGGELLLYDCPPDYLLDKIKYANDTLMEFNELSDLLVNKIGSLACSITLNSDLNKPKHNTQQSNRRTTRSSLTRHLSIRGRDSSINKTSIRQADRHGERFGNNEQRILTEANNKQQKSGNLICTLTRNLSLKTAKENRYKQATNSKLRTVANPHCTLPRNQTADLLTSYGQQFAQDRLQQQNLRRTAGSNNLFKSNDHRPQTESEWKNEPIIFKAYESVLRQLRSDEQLDKRENCLLALTTKSDNSTSNSVFKPNPMSSFRNESTNRSTGELDSNSGWQNNDSYSRKNSLDSNLNGDSEPNKTTNSVTSASMVAYLTVEHADNISQILKSWTVATMHSVVQLGVSEDFSAF